MNIDNQLSYANRIYSKHIELSNVEFPLHKRLKPVRFGSVVRNGVKKCWDMIPDPDNGIMHWFFSSEEDQARFIRYLRRINLNVSIKVYHQRLH